MVGQESGGKLKVAGIKISKSRRQLKGLDSYFGFFYFFSGKSLPMG